MAQLSGKIAIVTGGGSGIGRAISESFASAGASIAIFDLDENAANETMAAIEANGGKAVFIGCDVSSADSVAAALRSCQAAFGQPDILVNKFL